MTDNPYESPETVGTPIKRTTGGLKSCLIQGFVVVAVLGLLVALLLPNVRMSREPARRMQCGNNLKQIAVGLANYQDVYQSLPPAYTVDAEGKPLHSWRTLILPFVEQQTLYDKIDLSKPWDDPANQAALSACPKAYQCPSREPTKGHTTYLAVAVPGGCFRPGQGRKLDEITDDHDQTLMVIEVPKARAVPWMSPNDATDPSFLTSAPGEAAHNYGANAAFVSGRITFLGAKIKADTLRALISIAGNDDAVAEAED